MTLTDVEAREARMLRECLTYGLCGLDVVEQWADALLVRMNEPPYALVQLALARANGERSSLDAFDALNIGAASPDEIVFNLASADLAVLNADQLETYFLDLWQRAIPFLAAESRENRLVAGHMFDASYIELEAKLVRLGESSQDRLRELIAAYVEKARAIIAALGAPS